MTGVVLKVGAATDVGRARTVNQDSYILLPDRQLFAVADGMGGHQGGEVASKLAVDTLQATYSEPTTDALVEAIAAANERIHGEGDADSTLTGMGTTMVALALMPEEPDPDELDGDDEEAARQHLLIANVGDSRAYLFRDDLLTQITEDHSVVADLVREGRITQAEADVHPRRNVVTRVLGVFDEVEPDLWPVDPVVNDRYLLCSDGLFNEIGPDQISSVLRRLEDPDEAAAELVRLANEGGGRDNITVVIVDVADDGGVAEAASASLAGQPSLLSSDDPAGFSTAIDGSEPAAADDDTPPSRKERRAARRVEKRAAKRGRTRLTWRTLLFSLLILGVIGGAVATIQWYGTSTYFLGYDDDDDELVIFQGRPGGVLWVDPELVERTGVERADVPDSYRRESGTVGDEQPSRARARRLVRNIERDIADAKPPSTTTTTSAPAPVASTPPGTQAN